MEKKFKPFERVIYKEKFFNGCRWHCAFFSDYNESNGCVNFVDGKHYHFTKIDILPYEGYEHLVGTDLPADEEVRLEEGEWILTSDYIKGIKDGYCNGGRFIRIEGESFVIRTYMSPGGMPYCYAIRFKDFDPSNMEETKKHILCVKGGKIVKYKN